MTTKKKKIRKIVKLTQKQLIDAICKKFDETYRVTKSLILPKEKDGKTTKVRTLPFAFDCMSQTLYEQGLVANDSDAFQIDMVQPWIVYNQVKKHIQDALSPCDFLVDLQLQDQTDEFWDFEFSFAIKTMPVDCDLKSCGDAYNDDEDDEFVHPDM